MIFNLFKISNFFDSDDSKKGEYESLFQNKVKKFNSFATNWLQNKIWYLKQTQLAVISHKLNMYLVSRNINKKLIQEMEPTGK